FNTIDSQPYTFQLGTLDSRQTSYTINYIVRQPKLSIGRDAMLFISGTAGARYQIDFTDNPGRGWTKALVITPAADTIPESTGLPIPSPTQSKVFYRAVWLPACSQGC